jgi:CRP-like cAMP-binding protein
MPRIRCSVSSSASWMTRRLKCSDLVGSPQYSVLRHSLWKWRDGWDDEARLELPMTRRDIGDYLGLSIETVSRSITQLQRRRALARVEPRRMRLNQTTIDGMVEH